MASFFEGSLQDGISLAVRETKAVVCFVHDNGQESTTWEQEYFVDEHITPVLDTNAILLRIVAGSQEAGFLTSFCPIAKFPTVVVIKNGTLQEYLAPETTKFDFQSRLVTAVSGQNKPEKPTQNPEVSVPATQPRSAETPGSASIPASTTSARQYKASPSNSTKSPKPRIETTSSERDNSTENTSSPGLSTQTPTPTNLQAPGSARKQQITTQGKGKERQKSPNPAANKSSESLQKAADLKKRENIGPPAQYRLQVRLFDGSSVRSSFSPTQTIRNDVRSWLDQAMGTEQRPYNLKHILTPLPSRTLSVSEESQTLQDLGLGSTANLVMVPISSYTDAYSNSSSSLPMRGFSAVYNVMSSAVTTATGLLGSLVGTGTAGPNTSATEPSPAPRQTNSSGAAQRPGTVGMNIRTLRDQERDGENNQLYNGNQLNFQPREEDGKDH